MNNDLHTCIATSSTQLDYVIFLCMYVATLYVLALGTQPITTYLCMSIATFMICTHMSYVIHHVIVQCVVIASILYCYNYLSSWYLYVRLSVTDNSFTLFPLMVAGLVYQHSVRNRITIEANSQFSQFVSRTIIIDNKLL